MFVNLHKEEKQQILYNHIKLGRQERPFGLQSSLTLSPSPVIRFIPETARRLGDQLFTQTPSGFRYKARITGDGLKDE